MRNYLRYTWYVLRHKFFVLLACLEYGLIWRGIIHDWHKFLPGEYFPYANNDFTSDEESQDFKLAWNRHQKRADHHWQWWIVKMDTGQDEALEMSPHARDEMVADWRGAGKALGFPKTWEWYDKNKDKMILHPVTRYQVELKINRLREYHQDLERMKNIGVL